MTNHNVSNTNHPEELLAGYADGSASAEERRIVDEHLDACPRCREELALAKTGRAALMSLPELEGPGLTVDDLGVIETPPQPEADELAAHRDDREARRERRWSASWIALGGVAAVVALFAVLPFLLNRGGGSPATSAGGGSALEGNAGATPDYGPVRDRGIDYNAASIRALAEQLASKGKEVRTSGNEPAPSPSTVLAAAPPGRVVNDLSSSAVVQCAIRGAGLPENTSPVYLETAKFQGTPAYLVAVQTSGGAKSHLLLYVISQEGCSFLFEADQPL